MKITASIAAVLLASSGITYAQEATTVVAPSPFVERVPYQASELATQSGIRGLRQRVRQAVSRVCARPETFLGVLNDAYCERPVLYDAFAQVDRAIARSHSDVQAYARNISVRVR